MPRNINNLSLNGHLSSKNLKKKIREAIVMPNSAFEADFLWKVSLKILNSGLILKTFTHSIELFEAMVKWTCSNHDVHVLLKMGFNLKILLTSPDLFAQCYAKKGDTIIIILQKLCLQTAVCINVLMMFWCFKNCKLKPFSKEFQWNVSRSHQITKSAWRCSRTNTSQGLSFATITAAENTL